MELQDLWLGLLTLATLVLALAAPRRAAWPCPPSFRTGPPSWQRSIDGARSRPAGFPSTSSFRASSSPWGRLPLKELAARLAHDPPPQLLSNDWTLTRSAEQSLMHPSGPPSRWAGPSTVEPKALFAQALVDNARQALRYSTRPAIPNAVRCSI